MTKVFVSSGKQRVANLITRKTPVRSTNGRAVCKPVFSIHFRAGICRRLDGTPHASGIIVDLQEQLGTPRQSDEALLAQAHNERDDEYAPQVLLSFCNQAERVFELIHGACETRNLAALIPPIARLERSCLQLGHDHMAFTLGQVRHAAAEMNQRALRWLATTLHQEYATVSAALQDDTQYAAFQQAM